MKLPAASTTAGVAHHIKNTMTASSLTIASAKTQVAHQVKHKITTSSSTLIASDTTSSTVAPAVSSVANHIKEAISSTRASVETSTSTHLFDSPFSIKGLPWFFLLAICTLTLVFSCATCVHQFCSKRSRNDEFGTILKPRNLSNGFGLWRSSTEKVDKPIYLQGASHQHGRRGHQRVHTLSRADALAVVMLVIWSNLQCHARSSFCIKVSISCFFNSLVLSYLQSYGVCCQRSPDLATASKQHAL